MKIVWGSGPSNARVMIVGEAPGVTEAKRGRAFVGRAGKLQAQYLQRAGIKPRQCWMTNVMKEYQKGDPDPTAEQIRDWSVVLEEELDTIDPDVVIAVGKFATRWFLGDVTLAFVHGCPQRSPKTRATVVPAFHPAGALRDGNGMQAVRSMWDYQQAGRVIRGEIEPAVDEWEGREAYVDVGGKRLADHLARCLPVGGKHRLAIDTEGTTDNPWSIQVTRAPGMGWCMRMEREDAFEGIRALQFMADNMPGVEWLIHNAMYDLPMCAAMGLDLTHPDVHLTDTMYAAYLTRVEPQSLKALAWRHCGMRMSEYEEVAGPRCEARRIEWVSRVAQGEMPNPEPRIIVGNDGVSAVKTPIPWSRWAWGVLNPWSEGKEVDLAKRWRDRGKAVGWGEMREVEDQIGEWPRLDLSEVGLVEAVRYACRDTDATFRVAEVVT